MNELTATRKLPDRATMPEHTKALSQAIWLVTAGKPPGTEGRRDAEQILASMLPVASTARDAQIVEWLGRVNMGISQQLSMTDFKLRAPIIADAINDYPAGVFTAETARDAMRAFKWFPGAAELVEFLGPRARRIREYVHNIRRVVEFPVATQARQEPSHSPRDTVARVAAVPVKLAEAKALHRGPQEPIRTVSEQIAILKGQANGR